MKDARTLEAVTSLVIALSVVLVGACSRGGDDAASQETKTAVQATGNAPAPPGVLPIKEATASTGSGTVALAFDNDLLKYWNSEMFPPGWIQVDLGQPTMIARVRLYTSQNPPGPTTHQVLGGLTPDNLAPLGTLDGDTVDSQWLELETKGEVRYLRIATSKSPSWVGWREIQVYK